MDRDTAPSKLGKLSRQTAVEPSGRPHFYTTDLQQCSRRATNVVDHGVAPRWRQDHEVDNCMLCEEPFTLVRCVAVQPLQLLLFPPPFLHHHQLLLFRRLCCCITRCVFSSTTVAVTSPVFLCLRQTPPPLPELRRSVLRRLLHR